MAPADLLSLLENWDLSNNQSKRNRCGCVVMKRRARIRPGHAIKRKVRTLKRLIPNCGESMGVERLFEETADYIVALQIRVKLMQIMVDALSGCDGDGGDGDE